MLLQDRSPEQKQHQADLQVEACRKERPDRLRKPRPVDSRRLSWMVERMQWERLTGLLARQLKVLMWLLPCLHKAKKKKRMKPLVVL